MSFLEYKERISEGDTVIIFLGHNQMQSVIVTRGKIHQTKYGALPHSDMIGRTFGTKMYSVNKRGWVYLLHPTPELWTVNLPHRTQILYTTDISMVLLQLDIKPGSVVVESGTGSGSMSHSLIRSLAPTGHLYTFEFHQQRAEQAKIEFQQHKISELVTVECRDVCKNGFGLDHVADAVFLDLPSPWEAIVSAKQALKAEGGHICSFSPCIEQVQKSCDYLRSNGFRDVKVMECLSRTFEVKTVPFAIPNFGPTIAKQGEGKPIKWRKRKREQEQDPLEFTIQEDCAGVKAQSQSSSNGAENETSAVPEINAGSASTAASFKEMETSETTASVSEITVGSAASFKEMETSETTASGPEITAGSAAAVKEMETSETTASVPEITAGSAAAVKEMETSETTASVPEITAGSAAAVKEMETSETTASGPEITAGSAAAVKEMETSETTASGPEITVGSSCAAASLTEVETSEATASVPEITAGSSCTAASLTDTDPKSGLMRNKRTLVSQKPDKYNVLTAKPSKQMPGHTGYLTFATLFPQPMESTCQEN